MSDDPLAVAPERSDAVSTPHATPELGPADAPAEEHAQTDAAPAPTATPERYFFLRLAILLAMIIAVNGWVILQCDVNISALIGIQVALALGAAAQKLLAPANATAFDDLLRRGLYLLLRGRFLAVAGTVILSVMSILSVVVVTGEGAKSAC